jgi:hypothetical protein
MLGFCHLSLFHRRVLDGGLKCPSGRMGRQRLGS